MRHSPNDIARRALPCAVAIASFAVLGAGCGGDVATRAQRERNFDAPHLSFRSPQPRTAPAPTATTRMTLLRARAERPASSLLTAAHNGHGDGDRQCVDTDSDSHGDDHDSHDSDSHDSDSHDSDGHDSDSDTSHGHDSDSHGHDSDGHDSDSDGHDSDSDGHDSDSHDSDRHDSDRDTSHGHDSDSDGHDSDSESESDGHDSDSDSDSGAGEGEGEGEGEGGAEDVVSTELGFAANFADPEMAVGSAVFARLTPPSASGIVGDVMLTGAIVEKTQNVIVAHLVSDDAATMTGFALQPPRLATIAIHALDLETGDMAMRAVVGGEIFHERGVADIAPEIRQTGPRRLPTVDDVLFDEPNPEDPTLRRVRLVGRDFGDTPGDVDLFGGGEREDFGDIESWGVDEIVFTMRNMPMDFDLQVTLENGPTGGRIDTGGTSDNHPACDRYRGGEWRVDVDDIDALTSIIALQCGWIAGGVRHDGDLQRGVLLRISVGGEIVWRQDVGESAVRDLMVFGEHAHVEVIPGEEPHIEIGDPHPRVVALTVDGATSTLSFFNERTGEAAREPMRFIGLAASSIAAHHEVFAIAGTHGPWSEVRFYDERLHPLGERVLFDGGRLNKVRFLFDEAVVVGNQGEGAGSGGYLARLAPIDAFVIEQLVVELDGEDTLVDVTWSTGKIVAAGIKDASAADGHELLVVRAKPGDFGSPPIIERTPIGRALVTSIGPTLYGTVDAAVGVPAPPGQSSLIVASSEHFAAPAAMPLTAAFIRDTSRSLYGPFFVGESDGHGVFGQMRDVDVPRIISFGFTSGARRPPRSPLDLPEPDAGPAPPPSGVFTLDWNVEGAETVVINRISGPGPAGPGEVERHDFYETMEMDACSGCILVYEIEAKRGDWIVKQRATLVSPTFTPAQAALVRMASRLLAQYDGKGMSSGQIYPSHPNFFSDRIDDYCFAGVGRGYAHDETLEAGLGGVTTAPGVLLYKGDSQQLIGWSNVENSANPFVLDGHCQDEPPGVPWAPRDGDDTKPWFMHVGGWHTGDGRMIADPNDGGFDEPFNPIPPNLEIVARCAELRGCFPHAAGWDVHVFLEPSPTSNTSFLMPRIGKVTSDPQVQFPDPCAGVPGHNTQGVLGDGPFGNELFPEFSTVCSALGGVP